MNPFSIADEMLEAEKGGLAGRVADLERKVLEQGDELVCLKATLAEALRRVSILENGRVSGIPSTPSTPVRINGTVSKDPLRQRPLSYSSSKVDSLRSSTSTAASSHRLYQGSALPQRRAVHYQSTGKSCLKPWVVVHFMAYLVWINAFNINNIWVYQ